MKHEEQNTNTEDVDTIAQADRILVVGISGTGKTRLARELAELRDLPVVHLDRIFWLDNWVERPGAEVEQQIADSLKQPSWIIEGYIEPLGHERVDLADVVIDLDFSGRAAVRGGIERWRTTRRRARDEMPSGNVERLGLSFLRTMYRRDERPEIDAALRGSTTPIVRLRDRRSVSRLLTRLGGSAA
ncbi:MAG: hypothetical protein H0U59_03595 [Gemmatimonadaceae bacterium]|nr:hypothetical protein [Gemmatimonadaceae bacterium]